MPKDNYVQQTYDPITPPPDRSQRSWSQLLFSGFEADDTRTSLLRRWKARLTAIRSDGLKIELDFSVLQGDTPYKVGQEIADAFIALEEYRTCRCTSKDVCSVHKKLGESDAEIS